MKRGEIWWAELPAPVGSRPVIILTRDAVLENIGSIVVALVTRGAKKRDIPVFLRSAWPTPWPKSKLQAEQRHDALKPCLAPVGHPTVDTRPQPFQFPVGLWFVHPLNPALRQSHRPGVNEAVARHLGSFPHT